jgi:peptide/nickel transport system substrate-binding protein
MRKKNLYLLLTLFIVFAFTVVSCQQADAPTEDTTTSDSDGGEEMAEDDGEEMAEDDGEEMAEEDDRGVLRVRHGLVFGNENMNPVDHSRFAPVINMTYDQLTRSDADGVPQPWLAESWSASDSADVWTFNLRQDVFFHDGAQFTSADVAYSVGLWKDETGTIAAVMAIIDTVETPDDFTVVFNLASSHADIPLLLMDYRSLIVPENAADNWDAGIGTGPFILESLDPEGTTVLRANDEWWGGPVGLSGIEVIGIADQEATIAALQAGQLDMFEMTIQQASAFEGNDQFTIVDIPTGNWTGFIMRTDTAPFDDVRVRQAMRIVADRQAMVDLALSGAGVVSCDTPVMTGDQYKFVTDCSQDIDRAVELLADAGYPDGIDVELYTSADVCGDWPAVTEIYQQQAALAGIRVTLTTVPADGFWTDQWMVEPFVMTCWGQRPADQILNEAYRGGGSWNETYWNVSEFDALLDAARSELDFDARRQLYLDAQQMLWEQGGALIPYHSSAIRVFRSCLDEVNIIGGNDGFWHDFTKSASACSEN